MAEDIEKEDWIRSAVPIEEQKDIIVTTTDGYVYQVYYDEQTGKKEIEYIGRDDGKGETDKDNIPTITANYDKIQGVISAKANCIGGIKEIHLIYKGETVQTNLGETANFKVPKTGWYEIKAIANNEKTRSTWVRVSSVGVVPLIEVISDGEQENDWYGKDDRPVEVKISTEDETVERIYYKTNKDQDFTYVEGRVATLTIQDSGRTIIYAYVTDKQENESEQANKEIRYDNVHPEVGEIEVEGTKGIIEETETGWYVSEEVTLKLNNMTDEPQESGIVGYYYFEIPEGTNPSEITEDQKTYVNGATGEIKISKTKEGKTTIGIEAKDKAGNITESPKTITIYKDSEKPIDFLPSIVANSITANGLTVTSGTTDTISGISHYNLYIKQGNNIIKEEKNNAAGSFKIIGLTGETMYNIIVEAVDKAGNIKTGTGITATTITANVAPTKAIVSFNTKGTNYIKVNTKSTDANGDKLIYTLRYGTSSNNLNYSTNLTNQAQNVQTTITTPGNLSEYTNYYWRVDVSDGKATTLGNVQGPVRTYCTASLCWGGSYSEEECPITMKVTGKCVGKAVSTGNYRGVSGTTVYCSNCHMRGADKHEYLCGVCSSTLEKSYCIGCVQKRKKPTTIDCTYNGDYTTVCSICHGTRYEI